MVNVTLGDLTGTLRGSVVRLLRLKRRRLEKGWTLADLSQASGLSTRALSLIERGEREPRASNIGKLAAALECEPRELMEPERT